MGAGIAFALPVLGYAWYGWYLFVRNATLPTSQRQSRSLGFCWNMMLSLRFTTLLVFLSSFNWIEHTLPTLVETELLMRELVEEFPENYTLAFNTNDSTLRLEDFDETRTSSVAVGHLKSEARKQDMQFLTYTVSPVVLEIFQAEMAQTPLVDLFHNSRSMGGFYDIFFRIICGQWLGSVRSSSHPAVIDSTELQVGEEVLFVDKYHRRLLANQNDVKDERFEHSEGTVVGVFPSHFLENFQYKVEWKQNGSSTIERAAHLIPKVSKIYFFPQVTGILADEDIPDDALVVYTQTHVAILQGYSYYFNEYWVYTASPPPSYRETNTSSGNFQKNDSSQGAEEGARGLQNENMKLDADVEPFFEYPTQKFVRRSKWDQIEMCPEIPASTFWQEISTSHTGQWRVLHGLSMLFCEAEDPVILEASEQSNASTSHAFETYVCNKDIGQQNIKDLQSSIYPLFFAEANTPFSAKVAWFLLFFAMQCILVFSLNLLVALLVLLPISYFVVNSLRHVDEAGTSPEVVMYSSLRILDCFNVWYHVPILLDMRAVFFAIIQPSWILTFHLFVCWVALFRIRWELERRCDAERKLQIQRRDAMHHVAPQSEADTDEQSCRICFGSEGELISPCLCDGSMRFVHLDCLSEWRSRSVQNSSFVRCDQCRYRYKISKTWIGIALRSSISLTVISCLSCALLYLAGAYCFKFVDWLILSDRLSDFCLGPKIVYFVREFSWESPDRTPTSFYEKQFVEFMTLSVLSPIYLELGHLVSAVVLVGIFNVLMSESSIVPWLWATPYDLVSADEGLSVYLGGRCFTLSLVGTYRFYSVIWHWWKSFTAKLIADHDSIIVAVPDRVYWTAAPGLLVETPFGRMKVVRHRTQDGVIEMESLSRHSKLGKEPTFRLYRHVSSSLQHDVYQ